MDNFLIIDDVDTYYIEQNSWLIVLQKQIIRNYYLFRLYEHDKCGKRIKISPKELHHKMKSSINGRIKNKIKDRKNQQKNSYLSESSNASLNLRRNSQEMQKKNLLKILSKHETDIKKPCRYFIPPKLHQSPQNRQIYRQSVKKFNFLPFPGASMQIELSVNITKKQSKKLIQRQHKKMSKVLSHTKPILSLHDLQLQTKDLFHPQQTYFHKQLTKMEKHLLRTQMNSTKKELGSMNGGKNCFVVKKVVEELPQIGRLDCKSMICSYPESTKHMKTPHVQTQPVVHYSLTPQLSQQTPQTKQSSQCDHIAGLESYLQSYINSKKSAATQKDQVFEDNHISISKTTMVRNYRISKVRNINFPVC